MNIRAHQIRLDPSAEQAVYFARACGVARFAYNWALAEWTRQYKAGEKPNEAKLRRQLNAAKAEVFPWMAEVTKCAPQVAIKNLGKAFDHFFRRVALANGGAAKKKAKLGYPQFKRKGVRDSFRADNGPTDRHSHAVQVVGRTVKLPRCGVVKMREALRFEGRVISATVRRMGDGWYVSLQVETEQVLKAVEDRGAVGVDLGINTLATFSDGGVAHAIKPHRAAHKRIVRLSRSLSRKRKGSANRAKAKARLARLHLRVANVRKDGLHKLTTTLATNYSTIGIEDLNVSGMLKNGKLARAIADAGFFEFRRQLKYKAAMTGAQVIVIDRFYPSSKTCSACGAIHAITLADRVIECDFGLKMDRDLNAAINIRRQSLAQQSVERKALAVASATVKPASVKQKKSGLRSNVQTT
jgi:putative transposase